MIFMNMVVDTFQFLIAFFMIVFFFTITFSLILFLFLSFYLSESLVMTSISTFSKGFSLFMFEFLIPDCDNFL